MKVLTIVGTRPEIIRLSRVIARLDSAVDHVLVHTGQSYDYELSAVFFEELEIRAPDHFLNAAGATPMETVGQLLPCFDAVLEQERPDAVLVLGDTNSALAVIAAKRRKIPIFHMEAGNRCFDERVPEEINRKIVDHISDINLPYSTLARDNLVAEGLPSDRIIKTGSPMREVLAYYSDKIAASTVLEKLALAPGGYFVVSCHREENVDRPDKLRELISTLNELASSYGKRIIFSVHPRTRKRLEQLSIGLDERIEMLKPLGFLDYIHLQQHAVAVLSDSGTITEEASILGFPALNLRDTHERPEGMEAGAVMMTGIDSAHVRICLAALLASSRDGRPASAEAVNDYKSAMVSDKVLRIVLSYTNYVNRTVWKQY